MTTDLTAYNPTMIPGCRWDFRRYLRAERRARSAEANRDTIAGLIVDAGGDLETAAVSNAQYRTALEDAQQSRATADARRAALVACIQRMGRPDVTGPAPGAYIDAQPETHEDFHEPVPLPPGVTEDMDEEDWPPQIAERCGAASRNFARYGYCDRRASKDGGYCHSHA